MSAGWVFLVINNFHDVAEGAIEGATFEKQYFGGDVFAFVKFVDGG